jgi:hypothetical protein
VVGPQAESIVTRPQGVSDHDREEAAVDEETVTLPPCVPKDRVHGDVVPSTERAKESVPLGDHRIRRRGDDEVDGRRRKSPEVARIASTNGHPTARKLGHRTGEPGDG